MASAEQELISMIAQARNSRKTEETSRQNAIREARTFINNAGQAGLRRVIDALLAAANDPRYVDGDDYAQKLTPSAPSISEDGASVSLTVVAKPFPPFTYTVEALVTKEGFAAASGQVPKLADGVPTGDTVTRPLGKLTAVEPAIFNVTEEDVIRDFTAAYREYLENVEAQKSSASPGWGMV